MIEPRRLLFDPETVPFERSLLDSWAQEQPPEAARLRALAIVGGGGVVAGAGAAALASKVASFGGLVALKWTIVAVALLAVGATTFALLERSAPMKVDPVAQVTAAATAPAQQAATVEPPTFSPAELPAAAPSVAAVPTVVAVPPAPRHEVSLADEIALFDRARAGFGKDDPSRVLATLDDYERRFPNGAFAEEAQVLRVRTLLAKGDRALATRLGERFIAEHPKSPHVARLRAILDLSPPSSHP